MAACPECGTDNAEPVRFCSSCGLALAATGPERRKIATLLFCDLVGSTALGESVDPEALRGIMARYFAQSRVAIERHGGTVEKFIGDAVMAVFGVPVVHEDDAVRAVRAAAELHAGVAALNDELEARYGQRIALRIGVNTGEIVAGGETTSQMIVTGDAVNVAARLEQHADPGETLLGETTYRLVAGHVDVEPVDPIAAKGKSQAVRAHRLVAVRRGSPMRIGRLGVPMVGRRAELEILRNTFDEVVAKARGQLVVVAGEPGVGKSRLATELLGSLAGEATVLRGRCLSYGEGITYWPLREVLKRAAGIEDTDTSADAVERIVALLAAEERGREAALAVAQAVGLTGGAASADDIAWAVRSLLEALARTAPVVVLLDDLHWAEPTFLDLVERAAALSKAPVFFLCLARAELLDQRPEWERLRLEPLDSGQSSFLVESLLADADLPAKARRRAIESAGGNPLFVEELVAMLLEDPEAEAPPSLEALLGARLDRLSEQERAAAERGAVEGQVFHRGAVEELSGEPGRVAGALAQLEAKELVRATASSVPDDQAFRFRHGLIRDVAYRAVPKRLRSELHERYARWLERVAGERVTEYGELLGYHLEQAYRYRAELGPVDEEGRALGAAAADWLSSAADRAFVRGDMRAAANLLGRAAGLHEGGTVERLGLLPELARALRFSDDVAAAEAILDEAAGAAATLADPRLRARVEVEAAFLALYTDPAVEAAGVIRAAEAAAEIFTEAEDELGLAKSWSLVGFAHWHLCRGAAMEEAVEHALTHMQRSGDLRERWWILTKLFDSAVFGPMPADEAVRRCADLVTLGENVRSLEMSAAAAVASLEAMRGNFEAARELYAQSRAIAEELGLTQWLASLGNFTGPVELLAGDLVAAERELRRGYEELDVLGESAVRSTTAAFLSRALVLQGRMDEAERYAEISARAGSQDDRYTHVVWRGALASVLVARGDLARAEVLAREAVAIAAETDFLILRGESLLDLAAVLGAAGQDEQAAEAVREALELFRAKGCSVLADRAQALLDHSPELTVGS